MKIKNLIQVISALVKVRLFGGKLPLFVSWQITSKCNLRCRYCDYWKDDSSKEVSTDEAIRIVDELAELGTIAISFTGGEPLLRDDLKEITARAKARAISCKVNTNGILVPKKIGELDHVSQVNLSFDGPEDIHDGVRGKGSYKALIDAARALKGSGKKTAFHVVLSRYNVSHLDFILDKCRQLDVGAFFQPATELFLLNKDANPHSPEKDSYDMMINKLIERKRAGDRYVYNSISGLRHLACWPHGKKIYCSAGRIMFRINSGGELYHCERFPAANRISCLDGGVPLAVSGSGSVSCDQCWCGPQVELNLSMSGKPDAVMNALKL